MLGSLVAAPGAHGLGLGLGLGLVLGLGVRVHPALEEIHPALLTLALTLTLGTHGLGPTAHAGGALLCALLVVFGGKALRFQP